MYKVINFIFVIIIILFFFSIFKFYSSNNNVKKVNLNRNNIEDILKTKITNIPILENNTNDIIEFNSSFSEDIKNDQPRNYWNLFKVK
jgi:heme/copper-type cytochrome/quinol oxidase subunit 2